MNRINYSILAGLLAAAIGLVAAGGAAAADAKNHAGRMRARSPAADAPLLGRVTVSPSPAQRAKLLVNRRRIEQHKRANAGRPTGAEHAATVGAL